MTANAGRRTRRTVFGGVTAMVLTAAAVALGAVGVLTLRDSSEGETVGVDDRPVETFPSTPNLAMAVHDDAGALTSVIVATLLPEGRGGSIVVVPVNADASVGLGPTRLPLNATFAADDPEGFRASVESLLSITVERVEVAGPDRLAEIIDPLVPVVAEFPTDVVDSDTFGSGIVVDAGEGTLRGSLVVGVVTAVDDEGVAYDHHGDDVEVWSALAENTPIAAAGSEIFDDPDRPPPPNGVDDFFERLWTGPVQVRDVAVNPGLARLADNPNDDDLVVVDRRDSLLVFAQVSPSLVSTPNEGLTFRLEVRLSDTQLAAADDALTRSDVSRELIGELLFFQANVVSVDTAPADGGAPSLTRLEVADERFVEELTEFAPVLFSEADVVVASALVDGVDVVVKLGTGYLNGEAGASDDTVADE